MAIFNSYVKLPEGNHFSFSRCVSLLCSWPPWQLWPQKIVFPRAGCLLELPYDFPFISLCFPYFSLLFPYVSPTCPLLFPYFSLLFPYYFPMFPYFFPYIYIFYIIYIHSYAPLGPTVRSPSQASCGDRIDSSRCL